jgi:zinc protease
VTRCLVVWLLALAACGLGRTPPPAPPRTASLGLDFETFELTNGMRVVLVKDPKATEIQVTTRYRVGATDDPTAQHGMAHLVEHLMYEQVLGGQTLFAQLEAAATFFNATTTYDSTTYIARADASRLEKLLAIEAVRVGFRCTTIDETDFLREREVVVNEVRYRDEPTEAYLALLGGVYPEGHPYRRAVGGTIDSVGSISFKDACAFADAHYTPENGVLVVSGNVTSERLEGAIGKFLARVAARPTRGVRQSVPRAEHATERATIQAPIDDTSILLAWPLPADPLQNMRMQVIGQAAANAIDATVAGRVQAGVVGDDRAPVFTVVVELGDKETIDEVTSAINDALEEVPVSFQRVRGGSFEEVGFDRMQQMAIYDLYAGLEESSDRDSHLAGYVLEGRSPSSVLTAQFKALRELTPQVAADLARERFTYGAATVVVIEPSEASAGARVALRPPVHARGQKRERVDPAEAHAAETRVPPPATAPGMTTRRLPNGLTVVLLPLTSVPTVEMRLVFAAGTADEPAAKRGAALVAARGLGWDLRYFDDLIHFIAAGGSPIVDVATDRTAFIARGIDMHLDILLSGLRRWVREGTYDSADVVVDAMRLENKRLDDEGTLTDAWREALFGATDPYVHAGLVRHASTELTVFDAEQFRAAHYTPDNATLVIAGRFDPVLADRWIDYLFADWSGTAVQARPAAAAPPAPATVGMLTHTTSVDLRIALPAVAGTRAQRLVAAAMLAEIATDVRHQLGAAYVIDAELVERRRLSHYQIAGTVDATRAVAAVELLRDRLATLHTDPDVAARAFVAARRRVLTKLRSIGGSAVEIASGVERDIDLGRAPLENLALGSSVAALRIEDLDGALAELDLAKSAVMLRGPHAVLDGAFAALARKPRYVMTDVVAFDAREDAPTAGAARPTRRARTRPRLTTDDLEDSLTGGELAAPSRWAVMVSTGYALASTVEPSPRVHPDCCSGAQVSVFAGYRIDRAKSVGLQVTAGYFTGSYTLDLFRIPGGTENVMPIHIGGAILGTAYDRLWGGVDLGLHVDRRTLVIPPDGSHRSENETGWATGLGIGIEGGVDIAKLASHRLGLFGLIQGTLAVEGAYSSLTLGVAYRH